MFAADQRDPTASSCRARATQTSRSGRLLSPRSPERNNNSRDVLQQRRRRSRHPGARRPTLTRPRVSLITTTSTQVPVVHGRSTTWRPRTAPRVNGALTFTIAGLSPRANSSPVRKRAVARKQFGVNRGPIVKDRASSFNYEGDRCTRAHANAHRALLWRGRNLQRTPFGNLNVTGAGST